MTIEIANRLCAYRKKAGFSQEELAEKIGVSRQAFSKWERVEASPDTDNLILLAKIYNVTLDDLLNRDPVSQTAEPTPDSESEYEVPLGEEEKTNPGDTAHVSFKKGIHVHSKDGDHVHVDWRGVHVDSHDGDHVHVSFDGIHVEENGHIHVHTDEDGVHVNEENVPSPAMQRFHKLWDAFPYPVLTAILYIIFGFFNICGGWALGWLIFLTIPIYYSIGDMIVKKDLSEFCYPVFITILYLYLGFYEGLWHPMWLLFVTIPLFYFICDFFKSIFRKNKKSKSSYTE